MLYLHLKFAVQVCFLVYIFRKLIFFHACVTATRPRVQIIKLENENLVLIEEIEFIERYSDQPRK